MPPNLLADLQAGLLDDETAARLRRRIRTDPRVAADAAALDRVRREIAHLGSAADTAPDVPPEVTARLVGALSDAPPAHAARPAWRPGRGTLAAAVGAAAVVLAGGLVITPAADDEAAPPTRVTANRLTAPTFPVSRADVLRTLDVPVELGPLADPGRWASCLAGLGRPADTAVLGARVVDEDGRPAVLAVLPGETPGTVAALLLTPDCGLGDSGLIAATALRRPG